ncbi:MAG TPA: galactokinase [Bacteroidales bacterium]|nr:galactokinase [Bacteroidales bacterium]
MKMNELLERFIELYGDNTTSATEMYFSPGRVNLIGEHTDYNGGYVFPCALDFGTYLVIRKNGMDRFRFATTNFDDRGEINIITELEKKDNHWYNYPLGVIDQFRKQGARFEGLDFLFSGEIPNGAGLSSSASIETVTAFALNEIFNLDNSRLDIVKLSQKAENQFVGVNCGIMDQFAVTMGKANHAIFLNCATLDYELVPLIMDGHKLIISNTNKRRGLADSKYNERRTECETAVDMLGNAQEMENLSQINFARFIELKDEISSETVYRRARHVISENKRVLDAIGALKNNDLVFFGKLMNASHDSLRDDYEVTGEELDTLVEEARKIPGVLGSRMTGAGFGGCTVSLVEDDVIEQFKKVVGENYKQRTGLTADFYIAGVGDGTKKIS